MKYTQCRKIIQDKDEFSVADGEYSCTIIIETWAYTIAFYFAFTIGIIFPVLIGIVMLSNRVPKNKL